MNKKLLNLINEIDGMAVEIEISASKAKTVNSYIIDFFMEKCNPYILSYRYEEMGKLSEIVRDYLLELEKNNRGLQKFLEQLHDEYTKVK